jgi:hypothetical protein
LSSLLKLGNITTPCLRKKRKERKKEKSCTQWYTPIIPELRRLRQEDLKFKARL